MFFQIKLLSHDTTQHNKTSLARLEKCIYTELKYIETRLCLEGDATHSLYNSEREIFHHFNTNKKLDAKPLIYSE